MSFQDSEVPVGYTGHNEVVTQVHNHVYGQHELPRSYISLIRGIVGALSPDTSSHFLDLGAGSGLLAHEIVKMFSYKVMAVEQSLAGLARSGSAMACFGEATQLPVPNELFSVVHTKDMLAHIPDKQAFFREMDRVLKPGGMLVLTTAEVGESSFRLHFRSGNYVDFPISDLKAYSKVIELVVKYKGKISYISPPYYHVTENCIRESSKGNFWITKRSVWMPEQGEDDWYTRRDNPTRTPRLVFVFQKKMKEIKHE